MLISFITTNSDADSSVFKTLLGWRLQFFIICVLCCILILICWWKQYIQNLSVDQNLKLKLDNDQKQPFETSTADTIRKIPLQTSASKRRVLVSKPFKRNNKKSSTLSSLKTNKSYRTTKTDLPVDPSSTIKILLVVSKENDHHKDNKHIDQTLSNISLLTIPGTEELKSKHISRSISIELPSTNIAHDISNKTENTSPNNKSKQQIIDDFEDKILVDPSETERF